MFPFLFWFGFKENFLVERKLFSTNVNNIQIKKKTQTYIYIYFSSEWKRKFQKKLSIKEFTLN